MDARRDKAFEAAGGDATEDGARKTACDEAALDATCEVACDAAVEAPRDDEAFRDVASLAADCAAAMFFVLEAFFFALPFPFRVFLDAMMVVWW
jgi:hypothetical protein